MQQRSPSSAPRCIGDLVVCVHAVAHAGGRTWLATEGGLYVLAAPARL